MSCIVAVHKQTHDNAMLWGLASRSYGVSTEKRRPRYPALLFCDVIALAVNHSIEASCTPPSQSKGRANDQHPIEKESIAATLDHATSSLTSTSG